MLEPVSCLSGDADRDRVDMLSTRLDFDHQNVEYDDALLRRFKVIILVLISSCDIPIPVPD